MSSVGNFPENYKLPVWNSQSVHIQMQRRASIIQLIARRKPRSMGSLRIGWDGNTSIVFDHLELTKWNTGSNSAIEPDDGEFFGIVVLGQSDTLHGMVGLATNAMSNAIGHRSISDELLDNLECLRNTSCNLVWIVFVSDLQTGTLVLLHDTNNFAFTADSMAISVFLGIRPATIGNGGTLGTGTLVAFGDLTVCGR